MNIQLGKVIAFTLMSLVLCMLGPLGFVLLTTILIVLFVIFDKRRPRPRKIRR